MMRNSPAFLLVLAACCALVSTVVDAQEVTFGASVTNANGSLTTVLTWDAPGASGCVGSGHPDWEGEKSASGTQQLPAITLSGTYQLTLSCAWAGDTTTRLEWKPATKNTDGTDYTNAKGHTIHYGEIAEGLGDTVGFFVPFSNSYVVEGLDEGKTYFFCVKSVNTNDVSSVCSAVASKTTKASSSESAFVSLTVNPVPREPTDLTAK